MARVAAHRGGAATGRALIAPPHVRGCAAMGVAAGRAGSLVSSNVVALLGREKEIEVIRRFLEVAAADGHALLFTGPAGIGRTAVLETAASMASAAGAVVVRAAGVADEADLPFAGLSQLLAPLGDVVQRLDPGHRAVLSAVLGQDGGAGYPVDGAVVVAASSPLWRLRRRARPVVVAVDDLPMMDAPSAECLRSLARHLSGRRIGLMATARTAAGGDSAAGDYAERRLSPLDEEAAAAVLASRAPRLRPSGSRPGAARGGGQPARAAGAAGPARRGPRAAPRVAVQRSRGCPPDVRPQPAAARRRSPIWATSTSCSAGRARTRGAASSRAGRPGRRGRPSPSVRSSGRAGHGRGRCHGRRATAGARGAGRRVR